MRVLIAVFLCVIGVVSIPGSYSSKPPCTPFNPVSFKLSAKYRWKCDSRDALYCYNQAIRTVRYNLQAARCAKHACYSSAMPSQIKRLERIIECSEADQKTQTSTNLSGCELAMFDKVMNLIANIIVQKSRHCNLDYQMLEKLTEQVTRAVQRERQCIKKYGYRKVSNATEQLQIERLYQESVQSSTRSENLPETATVYEIMTSTVTQTPTAASYDGWDMEETDQSERQAMSQPESTDEYSQKVKLAEEYLQKAKSQLEESSSVREHRPMTTKKTKNAKNTKRKTKNTKMERNGMEKSKATKSRSRSKTGSTQHATKNGSQTRASKKSSLKVRAKSQKCQQKVKMINSQIKYASKKVDQLESKLSSADEKAKDKINNAIEEFNADIEKLKDSQKKVAQKCGQCKAKIDKDHVSYDKIKAQVDSTKSQIQSASSTEKKRLQKQLDSQNSRLKRAWDSMLEQENKCPCNKLKYVQADADYRRKSIAKLKAEMQGASSGKRQDFQRQLKYDQIRLDGAVRIVNDVTAKCKSCAKKQASLVKTACQYHRQVWDLMYQQALGSAGPAKNRQLNNQINAMKKKLENVNKQLDVSQGMKSCAVYLL